MKRFRHWEYCVIFVGFISSMLLAYPFDGEEQMLRQPDKSRVKVIVWGDEFYQRIESIDGYTLMRESTTQWICYAYLSADKSTLVTTGVHYMGIVLPAVLSHLQKGIDISAESRNAIIQKRQLDLEGDAESYHPHGMFKAVAAAEPISGDVMGLTMLIDFPDDPATMAKTEIENLLNQKGYTGYGNAGSVNDYYRDVSNGKLNYTNTVVGYYRAKQPKTYYNDASATGRAKELVKDALMHFDLAGFNFATLSQTSTKRVRAVNIMYAGAPDVGWSVGLWPHSGSITTYSTDGVTVSRYQMSSIGTSLRIGTFCHENGHMVCGWKDLYDYGSDSKGVGKYCIMASSSSTAPVPPNAYYRNLMGWETLTDITAALDNTTFTHIANTNTSFVYNNPARPQEHFYIESRAKKSRSINYPDAGLVIWHVDSGFTNDSQKMTATSHYYVSVEQADGKFDLEKNINSGAMGDLFKAGYKARFSDTTLPSSNWWNGAVSGLWVDAISAASDTMKFTIRRNQGSMVTISALAGTHGTISPSGQVGVLSGSTRVFTFAPDSGWEVDSVLVNNNPVSLASSYTFSNVTTNQSIRVVFGVASGIAIIRPDTQELISVSSNYEIRYTTSGDPLAQVKLELSLNDGSTYSTIVASTPNTGVYAWTTPSTSAVKCRIKISDVADGKPSAISKAFGLQQRPQLALSRRSLAVSLAQSKTSMVPFEIKNGGAGILQVAVYTRQRAHNVLINEIYAGSDTRFRDGIELWNQGMDKSIAGYSLVWEDNENTSGSFTFGANAMLKSGATAVLIDTISGTSATVIFMGKNINWSYATTRELSVSLLDAKGKGVDFFKNIESTDAPPVGTRWLSRGVSMSNEVTARTKNTDSDSAYDFASSAYATVNALNPGQTNTGLDWLLAQDSIYSVSANGAALVSCGFNATFKSVGSMVDTLYIAHNDPMVKSPLAVVCTLSVVASTGVEEMLARSTKINLHSLGAKRGILFVECYLQKRELVSVSLFDAQGRTLQPAVTATLLPGLQKMSIPLGKNTGIQKMVYVRLQLGEKTIIKKYSGL